MARSLSSSPPGEGCPRILIIEDESVTAMLIREMLHELGYGVSGIATNPSSTEDELRKHNFDAVLLDLILDDHRGPEIADLLIELKLPFAFVSWHALPSEPRHCKVSTLHKPLRAGQLREVLQLLVGPPRANEWKYSARNPIRPRALSVRGRGNSADAAQTIEKYFRPEDPTSEGAEFASWT